MARRASSGINHGILIGIAIIIVAAFFGGKALLGKKSESVSGAKIDMADVLAIRDGKKTIEDVVADWYSFQSISSIHAAFHEWFGIDFRGIVRRRKKIGRRLPFLERRLAELIEFRHGLVHRFEINLQLQKEQIEEILDLVRALIDVFVEELEKRRGTPIRD